MNRLSNMVVIDKGTVDIISAILEPTFLQEVGRMNDYTYSICIEDHDDGSSRFAIIFTNASCQKPDICSVVMDEDSILKIFANEYQDTIFYAKCIGSPYSKIYTIYSGNSQKYSGNIWLVVKKIKEIIIEVLEGRYNSGVVSEEVVSCE